MGSSLSITSQDHAIGRGQGRSRAGNAAAWGLVVPNRGDDEQERPSLALARRPEPVDPGSFSMSGFG